jgi:hypothetical protein
VRGRVFEPSKSAVQRFRLPERDELKTSLPVADETQGSRSPLKPSVTWRTAIFSPRATRTNTSA